MVFGRQTFPVCLGPNTVKIAVKTFKLKHIELLIDWKLIVSVPRLFVKEDRCFDNFREV